MAVLKHQGVASAQLWLEMALHGICAMHLMTVCMVLFPVDVCGLRQRNTANMRPRLATAQGRGLQLTKQKSFVE